jgi:hypothetical protein
MEEKRRTTTTFWTSVVLEFIIDNHPDCIVRIGWETCASDVTFGELWVSRSPSCLSEAREVTKLIGVRKGNEGEKGLKEGDVGRDLGQRAWVE